MKHSLAILSFLFLIIFMFPATAQETAKANKLRLYEYFNYLLTEIPEHMDDKNNDFCEKLLPWSDGLPAECRK